MRERLVMASTNAAGPHLPSGSLWLPAQESKICGDRERPRMLASRIEVLTGGHTEISRTSIRLPAGLPKDPECQGVHDTWPGRVCKIGPYYRQHPFRF